jgi:DNA-binding LacI/PurR family transcriptional regulator
MTKFGETHNYKGYDFVKKIEEFIDRKVDGIVANTEKPSKRILRQYMEQKSEFVEMNGAEGRRYDRVVYSSDMLDISGDIVRHNPQKLAAAIKDIIERGGER